MKDKARNGELLRGPELLTIASTKGELPQGPSEPTRCTQSAKSEPLQGPCLTDCGLGPIIGELLRGPLT